MRARLMTALALMTAAVPPPALAQEPLRADTVSAAVVAEGKRVFEGKAGGALCFSCHGFNAQGMPGIGPNLRDRKWLHGDGTLAFLEKVIKAGVTKPKESAVPMLPMGGAQLNDAQVKAVAAYIYSMNSP